MNVEVNESEDTEWNDILRQHKIIPEKPPSPTLELERLQEEEAEFAHANRLENKTLDELDELDEDGLEDEDFIEEYRRKRIAQIKEMASREKYGDLVTITKSEYSQEVTEASKDNTFVLLHISYNGVPQCRLLHGIFVRLAPKFREIKFVEIDARQINDKYRQESCPTILVYKDTQVISQIVTLASLGGNSTNLQDITQLLVQLKAVDPQDPRTKKSSDDGYSSDSESEDDLDI